MQLKMYLTFTANRKHVCKTTRSTAVRAGTRQQPQIMRANSLKTNH